jgi:hypothetical protein
MLVLSLALTAGLAVVAAIAFIILCLGIRREDRAGAFDKPAPGFAARQARRFTGPGSGSWRLL